MKFGSIIVFIDTSCCAQKTREIMMHVEELDVFDFDGTLIKVNSFQEITRRFLFLLLKSLRMKPVSTLAFWYVLRRLGVTSHLAFKKRVVHVFERSFSETQKQNICQRVFDVHVNKSVLERIVSSENCLVCTAAPYAYISRISFGTDVPVISSLDPHAHYPDAGNFAAGKIENLKVYFKGKSFRVVNFFTDSRADDQALIEFSMNAFMVKDDFITRIK